MSESELPASGAADATRPEAEAMKGALEGRLYGLDLVSDFPLVSHLDTRRGRVDLRFSCSGEGEPSRDFERARQLPLLHASALRVPASGSGGPVGEEGESITQLRGTAPGAGSPCHLLRFAGVAEYLLLPESIRCRLLASRYRFLVEIRLLGPVLAFWLEVQGHPALHASSVVIDGRAIGLLGTNGAGKTSLAAALVAMGQPLLSDDILVLDAEEGGAVRGRAGYPQMRLWPDQAAHFLPGGLAWRQLPRVHPRYSKRRVPVGRPVSTAEPGLGSFHAEACPLAALYLLERGGSERVEITPIAPRDALVELVRHSFSPHLAEAAGLQEDRLARFVRLLGQAPLRRLRYPEGWDRLPVVIEALHRDLHR